MDMLDEGLLRFWKYLDQYNVSYIMVGEFAKRFHGISYAKSDLELWLENTLSNRKSLRAAFVNSGYGDFPSIETMVFVDGHTRFYVENTIEVGIMTSMKGLEDMTFGQCFEQASIADLDGVQMPFLHINQLIKNKQEVNRPKDQIDVIELEKIKKLRETK
jgi:hypothetical protein